MKKGIILASGLFLLTLCSGCAALAQYGDLIAKGAYGLARYVFSHNAGKTDKLKEKQELCAEGSAQTVIPEISLQ
jgi:hypothetical protein